MKTASLTLPIVALAALGVSACSAAQAKAPATRPALEVPQPPPRIVETVTPDEPPAVEPVPELPPAPTASSRPRSQPASRESASREAPKQEAKPETPPPMTETAAPAAPPPNPAPQIRTTADNSDTARQVRDILDRANKALASIDYGPLSRQRKESYDTAKRFILQAEDAIKVSNFQYARYLADKADTLAKELQGR